ncbi:MAG: GTP-binding protein, partial [Ruthenibacterium sp.]
MKLYCITGFLGAGKTTFLKNFLRLFAEQRIFLLINEFGKT